MPASKVIIFDGKVYHGKTTLCKARQDSALGCGLPVGTLWSYADEDGEFHAFDKEYGGSTEPSRCNAAVLMPSETDVGKAAFMVATRLVWSDGLPGVREGRMQIEEIYLGQEMQVSNEL